MNPKQEILNELYSRMLKIRLTEESIANEYSEEEMRCPTHLSIGQEAIASGVCTAMDDSDFVLSTHRCHAHYIAKGGNLDRMIAEIYGKATGCSAGKGGSMHLIDESVGFMGSTAIVGNTIPLAVGLGLSIELRNSDNISCVFFGEGAIEEGVFYESVNFAVVRQLPVLFVCENNLYSVYSPLEVRQPPSRKIHKMVRSFGINTRNGDGNNVLEVYDLALSSISDIKSGRGPQFIELSTYRWLEHCGPNYDNDIGYRTEEEFLEWKKLDPIKHCETNLLMLDNDKIKKAKKDIQEIVDGAFVFAKESPFPEHSEIYTNLYTE